jgi:hypothetical protein
MAVLVSDSFNRANSTTSLGSTDSYNGGTSKAWQIFGNAVYGINNNQAYISQSATSGHGSAYVEVNKSDVAVTTTFSVIDPAEFPKIAFRIVDAENMLMLMADAGTGNYLLYKYVSGSSTDIATGTSFANGDVIRIEANGSNIKVFKNGTNIINVTETSYQTATKHGLMLYKYPNSRMDNFIIEDLATGGVIVDAGTLTLSGDTTLTANGSSIFSGDSNLVGDTTLTANGSLILDNASSLSGDGSLTVNGSLLINGTSTLDASGTIDINGTILLNADISLSGSGSLVADGDFFGASVTANLDAISSLIADGSIIVKGDSTLNADTVLNAIPSLVVSGLSSLSASGGLIADGTAFDPTKQIISKINLQGEQKITTLLSTQQDLTVRLNGEVILTIRLVGDIK